MCNVLSWHDPVIRDHDHSSKTTIVDCIRIALGKAGCSNILSPAASGAGKIVCNSAPEVAFALMYQLFFFRLFNRQLLFMKTKRDRL